VLAFPVGQYFSHRFKPRVTQSGSYFVRLFGRHHRSAMGWLIVFAFILGTLSPFLSGLEKRQILAGAPNEVEQLSLILGESAQSLSASFCVHAEEALPAPQNKSGKPQGKQDCPICCALHDFQAALPPGNHHTILVRYASKDQQSLIAQFVPRPRVERVGKSRAPPSLIESSIV